MEVETAACPFEKITYWKEAGQHKCQSTGGDYDYVDFIYSSRNRLNDQSTGGIGEAVENGATGTGYRSSNVRGWQIGEYW